MRKKIFMLLCCTLSIVLLISYFLIYIIFRSVLLGEIRQQQTNLQKYNETIFGNYIDSFDMVPFQLVNDEEIGKSLNVQAGTFLDMFRTKELLRKKFRNYLNQQLFTFNLDCRFLLYLDDNFPLAAHLDACGLSERVEIRTCNVYTSRDVASEEWYKRTLETTWSPYFFLNKDTDELCYAKCAWNYYLNSSINHSIGIVVIAIPQSAFLEKLTLEFATPDSSIFLTNEYGEILFSSGSAPSSLLSQDNAEAANRYLISRASVNDNLSLTFLTPYASIESMARNALLPYLLFAALTLFILIAVLYLLSRKITAPVISLASLIGNIQDTRSFDISLLDIYHDTELKMLCQSFSDLIRRENALVDRLIRENHAKRTAILHALQAQINPHFLYNALDSVSWMALRKREDSIADIVSSISNLMHYSISQPDALATLSQELDNIREFIRIYQLERPGDITLSVSAPEEQLSAIRIPKFTLQPLVENAILHNPDLPSLSIVVEVIPVPKGFHITVTDNGAGADPEKLNAFLRYEETDLQISSGFGIRNVNERLKLHYSNANCLSYRRTEQGELSAMLAILK